MTEAIICAIIAGVTAITVGFIDYLSQRKTKQDIKNELERNKTERQKREQDKENSRKDFELKVIKGLMASITLSEATAKAVQRIPDANCNGDMTDALKEEGEVKNEIRAFLTQHGVDNIID